MKQRNSYLGHILKYSKYYYYYYYLQLTVVPSHLRPTQLRTLLLNLSLLKAFLFKTSQEFTVSFKSFLMTTSRPNHRRPAFHLALDGCPKRTIFGNLSSFIPSTCPSHINLSFIIALESGIEPHFSYSLLFEIWSISRTPRTIRR